jgi:hypothetical protein
MLETDPIRDNVVSKHVFIPGVQQVRERQQARALYRNRSNVACDKSSPHRGWLHSMSFSRCATRAQWRAERWLKAEVLASWLRSILLSLAIVVSSDTIYILSALLTDDFIGPWS